jgi:hypothetical protein
VGFLRRISAVNGFLKEQIVYLIRPCLVIGFIFNKFEEIIKTMVTIIKRGSTKKEIREKLKRLKRENLNIIDLEKYCGTIKLKENPLRLQKQWRNEWD